MIDVQHIAKLARLGISKKEEKKLADELSAVLNYVEKLKEVDVSRVEPTSHPYLLENVMREDQVKKQSPESVNKLIEAVPEKKERYVKVKSIL